VARAVERFAGDALHLTAGLPEQWAERAEEVRTAFARLVNANADEIAFIQNTSAGLSLVAAGLDWQRGDNVVAVAEEYPSNVYPWFGLQRWGVQTRLLPRQDSRFGVDDLRAIVDGQTRLVSVSAVDWQTGFRADLAAIGEFCRRRDILFCVDAVQAVGALRVDVVATGVDCLATGGHKWLLAPEGCGALFVSRRVLDRIHPVLLGWKSVEHAEQYLPYHFELRRDAARLEPGSPPHLGIHAFGAAVDLLLEVGPDAIERRVLELTSRLAEGLRARGAIILSPWAEHERSGILTFRLGDARELQSAMTRAGIVTRRRLEGIRLAPHFYNNNSDIARVLEVVDEYRHAG